MSAATTGTAAMLRLALRRDRVLIPVWLGVFVVMVASSASATKGLYPTAAARIQAAELINSSQPLIALYGRIYDPTSLGALSMMKMGGLGAVFVALLSITLMVRHTRAEEETGRLELLGATVLGRSAALTAALLLSLITNLALAMLTTIGLIAAGLPPDGSIAFGLAWAGVGLAFAGIAAVAAQLATTARGATGLASATLGAVYVLRAIGDTAQTAGPKALTWLSPIGWGQQFRPYAGNRWWVLAISLGFAVAVTLASYVLAARRDLGAGVLVARPGPAEARSSLSSPLALAWRLQRGSLLGWSIGFALIGLIFGNIASSVSGILNNPAAEDFIRRLGGREGLTDAFLATELSFIGFGAAAYGVQAALRLRAEESTLHTEAILATATSRLRWALSHLTIALGGVAALMAVTGLTAGLAHAARVNDLRQVGRVLAAALVQVPAAWVLVGIVALIFGLTPRLTTLSWAVLMAFLLVGELGPLLELKQWVMDLSPFTHLPRLPGGSAHALPLVALVVIAALLMGGGLAGLRRRDIG